jgi:hypothetical protein
MSERWMDPVSEDDRARQREIDRLRALNKLNVSRYRELEAEADRLREALRRIAGFSASGESVHHAPSIARKALGDTPDECQK